MRSLRGVLFLAVGGAGAMGLAMACSSTGALDGAGDAGSAPVVAVTSSEEDAQAPPSRDASAAPDESEDASYVRPDWCPPPKFDPADAGFPRCDTLPNATVNGVRVCPIDRMLVQCETTMDYDGSPFPEPDPAIVCDQNVYLPGGPMWGWRKCCACAP